MERETHPKQSPFRKNTHTKYRTLPTPFLVPPHAKSMLQGPPSTFRFPTLFFEPGDPVRSGCRDALVPGGASVLVRNTGSGVQTAVGLQWDVLSVFRFTWDQRWEFPKQPELFQELFQVPLDPLPVQRMIRASGTEEVSESERTLGTCWIGAFGSWHGSWCSMGPHGVNGLSPPKLRAPGPYAQVTGGIRPRPPNHPTPGPSSKRVGQEPPGPLWCFITSRTRSAP